MYDFGADSQVFDSPKSKISPHSPRNRRTGRRKNRMPYKPRGLKFVVLSFMLLALFLLGCASEKGPAVRPPKPPKDDRAIDVVQKMRRQAVSRRVGRWAVVIGISDYKYDTHRDPVKGIPDLRFADRDARAFAQFLMSPEGGAFPADHVRLLTDRKATIKEVRKAIGDFLARSLEDDLVIIFYAGHGIPDPKSPENLYLAAYDTEPGNYYGTALPMWEIDVALNRTIRSKRVFVFADACHSAGVGGSRGKSVSKEFNEYMQRLAGSKEGVTKITASRADELSQERDNLGGGHGVFTYYLLQALSGKADENRDGFVTMTEAYEYLYDRVRSDTRHSQNPWASSYVSPDIPLGIVDSHVLAAIEARSDDQKQRPTQPQKPYRPQPVMVDLPEDSNVAIKLARVKLVKDEPGVAKEMVEGVIRRNDSAKPDALALKIEILLRDRDLREAEDTEDLLVIPYPNHPAAEKSARLVYDYYIKEIKGATPAEEIRQMETYLKRHPSGLLERVAQEKLKGIRSGVRTRYEKGFDERLVLVKGYINRNQFDRARAELGRAQDMARDALSGFGVTLNTDRVARLRTLLDTEEEKHLWDRAFDEAKGKASRQPLDGKIKVWRNFVAANPGNPHMTDAQNTLSGLEKELRAYRNRRFQEYFTRAEGRLRTGDYTKGYEALKKASEYATAAQTARVEELAKQYNAPPEVQIVTDSRTVNWNTPVRFKYRATDKEGDSVRAVSWDFGDGTTGAGGTPVHTYDKWGGPQKEQHYIVTLKATDGHTTVVAKKAIVVKRQDCVARDGRFCKYSNGIVKDTRTGLEWVAGPDRDTNWNEARSWVENLNIDGGGWRMPTIKELKTLYQKGAGTRNITPLFKFPAWAAWSGETKDSSSARYFDFYTGDNYSIPHNYSHLNRAFAVRSRNDG